MIYRNFKRWKMLAEFNITLSCNYYLFYRDANLKDRLNDYVPFRNKSRQSIQICNGIYL